MNGRKAVVFVIALALVAIAINAIRGSGLPEGPSITIFKRGKKKGKDGDSTEEVETETPPPTA